MAQIVSTENQEKPSGFTETIHWVVRIAAVIGAAVLVLWCFGSRALITGHSMEPSFNDEDEVLLDRVAYIFGNIGRFDAVGFMTNGSVSVKRVVGLPGETVCILAGSVYIDEKVLELPDYMNDYLVSGLAANEILLGEGDYFLLGDNGESSEDSRFGTVGCIAREDIIGKVWFCISPISRLGFVSD